MITATALLFAFSFSGLQKVSAPSVAKVQTKISRYKSPVSTPLPVNPDPNAHPKLISETPAAKAKRMKWWEDARFGLFLHWGSYSVPGGVWGGQTNYAEWIRQFAQIPLETYNKFAAEFDPTQFNADVWVRLAKNAGMKYIVITAKHHEGFNMFASKYSDYSIMNTPWHHDPMKDLAAACKKYGLKFCFYYSVMDWHDYNYLPRRTWEVGNRSVGTANFQTYAEYLFHEVDQLLTDYGPIGVMWFDGVGESTWKEPYGTELYNLCRTVQPNVIVNNRVINSRIKDIGDFETPEGSIPPNGLPDKYWETCMTMNNHWGYNSHSHDYKSVKTLVRNLVQASSEGGNYLLNIGPTGLGTFPPEAIDRLKGIGDWMRINSSAIYDTEASPYPSLPWGRCTMRRNKRDTRLYFEILDWPKDGQLIIPGTLAKVQSAHILGSPVPLKTSQRGSNLVIELPENAPNSVCPVVELVTAGQPHIFYNPIISTPTPEFTEYAKVSIRKEPGTHIRYTTNGDLPTGSSSLYRTPFTVRSSTKVVAAGFLDGLRVTDFASMSFSKVSPLPAVPVVKARPGLTMKLIQGKFASTGAVLQATAASESVVPLPNPYVLWHDHATTDVGAVFEGVVNVPATRMWSFRTYSADGSTLYVDGRKVVDNDGSHGPRFRSGTIPLEKGWHRLKLVYFNVGGGAKLNLGWSQRGEKYEQVPANSLGHEPTRMATHPGMTATGF